jgi:hypothetical protein
MTVAVQHYFIKINVTKCLYHSKWISLEWGEYFMGHQVLKSNDIWIIHVINDLYRFIHSSMCLNLKFVCNHARETKLLFYKFSECLVFNVACMCLLYQLKLRYYLYFRNEFCCCYILISVKIDILIGFR